MTTADPVLVERFRKLLTGEEKGYAPTSWQELARVAAEHYDAQAGRSEVRGDAQANAEDE